MRITVKKKYAIMRVRNTQFLEARFSLMGSYRPLYAINCIQQCVECTSVVSKRRTIPHDDEKAVRNSQ